MALACALVRGDWSLVYVADYASRSTAWRYRLAAMWAGMAGSLLLWAWFVAVWGVGVAWWCGRRRPALAAGLQAVLGTLLALFGGLLVWASRPFARLAIPAIDGGGLTPVLRHPAMLYHPPIVYAGAVGLAVPLALAVAGRARGRLPGGAGDWLGPARRVALACLALLAVGMVAGAHWAYVELGWGGYWAWDPVENGVLLPWLAGVGFVHAALLADATATTGTTGDGRAAARLAGLAFGLGLLGSFLTRSGATGSVHAFAEARSVGRVLLAGLALASSAWVVAGWLSWRRARLESRLPRRPPARRGALDVNTALLLAVVVTVGFGTVLPLLWRAVTGERLIVTGRYFASTTWPLALVIAGVVGPALARRRWRGVAALGASAGLLAGWLAAGRLEPFTLATTGLGGGSMAVLALVARDRWRTGPARLASVVAHAGVVVLLVGVAGTVAGQRTTGPLGPGQDVRLAGYSLVLERVVASDPDGPGAAARAEIALYRGSRRLATLRPEALVGPGGQRVAVAGLRSTPLGDVTVVLRAVGTGGDSARVDVAVTPLAAWVWWGGLLVAAGLVLAAASPVRGRVGPGPDSGAGRQEDGAEVLSA